MMKMLCINSNGATLVGRPSIFELLEETMTTRCFGSFQNQKGENAIISSDGVLQPWNSRV